MGARSCRDRVFERWGRPILRYSQRKRLKCMLGAWCSLLEITTKLGPVSFLLPRGTRLAWRFSLIVIGAPVRNGEVEQLRQSSRVVQDDGRAISVSVSHVPTQAHSRCAWLRQPAFLSSSSLLPPAFRPSSVIQLRCIHDLYDPHDCLSRCML